MTIIRRYQIAVLLVVLFGISIFAYRGSVASNNDKPAPSHTVATTSTEKKAAPQQTVAPLSGGLDIPQSVVASGGDTSTGDVLSLIGTIGQYATGTSTGNGLILTSGFLSSFLTSSLPDLTVIKTNSVSGSTTTGNSWTWTLHIANSNTTATFADGQTILTDNLPDTNISYGVVSVNSASVTGTINCNIDTNDLNCVASGPVSIDAGGTVDIQFTATPSANGSFGNPRGGGVCSVDPGSVVSESDETNNTCNDSVTVIPAPVVFTDPTGNCGIGNTPCFTSIQGAVNSIGSSGTVNVGGGSYPEVVNINQPITVNVNGDITILMLIYSQCTINAGSSNISIGVNFTNNGGTFNAGSGTVTLNGTGPQTIGGSVSTVFNNLTVNNSNQSVLLGIDETVNGTLTLTHDLDTSSFTLTMPGSAQSAGLADVIGTVKRLGFVSGGSFVSLGNQFNMIRIASGPAPSNITIKLTKTVPTDASTGITNSGFPNAVARTYVITPSSTGFSGVLSLHYLPSELNGNTEGPTLALWHFNAATGKWENKGVGGFSPSNHLVEQAGITDFSPWTFNSTLNSPVPTAANLENFTASTNGNGTLLSWQTGTEVNNLGFNVYRDVNGQRSKINSELIAGTALMVGGGVKVEAGNGYSWFDNNVDANSGYWLEDVDLNGSSTWHGPYGVTASNRVFNSFERSLLLSELNKNISRQNVATTQRGYPSDFSPVSNSSSSVTSVTSGRTPSRTSTIPSTLTKQWSIASQPAIKIAINKSGWYHLNMVDLMAAGLIPSANPQTLQMFVGGTEIPILINSSNPGVLSPEDSIEFYGSAIDTPYSGTQIYWLVSSSQTGKRIGILQSPVSGNNTNSGSFAYTVERKDRSIYFSSLRNGDAENWFGPVVNTQPVSETLNINHLDQNSASQAEIEIALQGVTTNSHQVNVMLNGTAIESISFNGLDHQMQKISVPESSLIEGDNQISLAATGNGDVSLIDYIRTTYAHSYTADSNSLFAAITPTQPVQIAGFTSNQIRAVGLANPNQPVQVEGTIAGGSNNYSISFGPTETRDLLVFTPDQMLAPLSITANQPSSLNKGGISADYLILTYKDFTQSIQPFVAFKQGQGYRVAVIDVEDIYDEFSYGVHTPYALKDFLNWTYLHWAKQPQYVLFAGSASLDPKNYTGLGYLDFVPTKLFDTANMETASDDSLVDFNNDGQPQMMIGRLPVHTAAEMTTVVNKIIATEQSGKSETMVLVSDLDDGVNFDANNEQIQSIVGSQIQTINIVRGQTNTDAKAELLNQLAQGQRIFNYAGHGSVSLWRGDFLTNNDVASLANTKVSPLIVTMTCLNGYFQDPHAASLGESLIKINQGGAAAVWTSTGMTDVGNQPALNQAFFTQLFGNANITLGQAIKQAKSVTQDNDVRRTWILFGDPTMKIR